MKDHGFREYLVEAAALACLGGLAMAAGEPNPARFVRALSP